MSDKKLHNELVFTVKDRCRVCYTCVRECPVRAIRIVTGQAEVISARCIGCGNCTRVCSQKAKIYLDSTGEVENLLTAGGKHAVCVAPSFPAEFADLADYRLLVGMLRKLGFQYVHEVAFGADLVAREYARLMDISNNRHSISSDCPAIVYYIRHYYPELTPYLAPVVSPMVATARVIRTLYGEDTLITFVGPCIAKKAESVEIDCVLTFRELRQLFLNKNITPENIQPSDFDEPKGHKAAIFPVTRGKLHSINKSDDICEADVIVASGRVNFREAIREFAGELNRSMHLELLCCEGCIMGPGMATEGLHYVKKARIRNYVRHKLQKMNVEVWEQFMQQFATLDLRCSFEPADRRIPLPEPNKINQTLQAMGKIRPEDHLNCGACGYDTCVEHAIAIIEGHAEQEMCLPYTIEKLHKSIQALNETNAKLASAQQSLKQSEKLATMGQLSAGIAHELNNPLGIITMYSNILMEELPENSPYRNDLKLIVEQSDRCRKIVGGLLNFARKNQVKHKAVDMETFVKHSLKSVIIPEGVQVKFQNYLKDPIVHVDTDQWMQVLTNLEKNAVEAMPEGGELTITLSEKNGMIEFLIQDTGLGIKPENMDKLFTPFFTTKPMGKGTGLGLPLIYGIVKMHRGQITVTSNANPDKGPTGTTFRIVIPRAPKTDTGIKTSDPFNVTQASGMSAMSKV